MRKETVEKEILEEDDRIIVSHTFQYNKHAGKVGTLIGIDRSGFKPFIVLLDGEGVVCFYESELQYKKD